METDPNVKTEKCCHHCKGEIEELPDFRLICLQCRGIFTHKCRGSYYQPAPERGKCECIGGPMQGHYTGCSSLKLSPDAAVEDKIASIKMTLSGISNNAVDLVWLEKRLRDLVALASGLPCHDKCIPGFCKYAPS
jgi:hypothetical protein